MMYVNIHIVAIITIFIKIMLILWQVRNTALIKHEILIEHCCFTGYAALHMAVENKDLTAVQKLIKSGANKDIPVSYCKEIGGAQSSYFGGHRFKCYVLSFLFFILLSNFDSIVSSFLSFPYGVNKLKERKKRCYLSAKEKNQT